MSMSKPPQITIKQWLKKLPEPYRSQALTNLCKQNPESADNHEDDLPSALMSAFHWAASPEGSDYWFHYTNKLMDDRPNFE